MKLSLLKTIFCEQIVAPQWKLLLRNCCSVHFQTHFVLSDAHDNHNVINKNGFTTITIRALNRWRRYTHNDAIFNAIYYPFFIIWLKMTPAHEQQARTPLTVIQLALIVGAAYNRVTWRQFQRPSVCRCCSCCHWECVACLCRNNINHKLEARRGWAGGGGVDSIVLSLL